MANRRMFSLDVVDTDKFLDMPLTAQCLYFHLGMRADDDGFINSPKRILRYIGSNDDDLKLLLAKGYLIPFQSGVVVISDWKKNNYIQSDRYKPTVYKEELSCLAISGNTYALYPECTQSVYNVRYPEYVQDVSILDTQGKTGLESPEIGRIQDVSKADTQDRLGKGRVGKDRLGKGRGDKHKPAQRKDCQTADNRHADIGGTGKRDAVHPQYQQIVDMYSDICISLPRITTLSEACRKEIYARCRRYSLEDFKRLFEMAEGSSFLKGGNGRNWSASFDWLMTEENMAKVLNGSYTDKPLQGQPKKPYGQFSQRECLNGEMDELEKKLLQNDRRKKNKKAIG